MNKRNLIPLLPMAFLLVAPWTHKLLFYNLMAAWPNIGADGAHTTIIIATIFVFPITIFLSLTYRD